MGAVFLDQRLTLEARDDAPDGAGGRGGAWVTLGELWGSLKASRGALRERDAAPVSRIGWTITVRAAPIGAPERPLAGQRFRLGDRRFRILAVAEKDARARLLRCFCEEERLT